MTKVTTVWRQCRSVLSVRLGLGALAFLAGASSVRAEGPTVVAVPGTPVLLLSNFDVAPLGYATNEFFISGTASSYKLAVAPTTDGHWNAVPSDTAPSV